MLCIRTDLFQCSICRGLGGLTPSGASQPPSFHWPPRNSQKNVADPLWFYHKSSTDLFRGKQRQGEIKYDAGIEVVAPASVKHVTSFTFTFTNIKYYPESDIISIYAFLSSKDLTIV